MKRLRSIAMPVRARLVVGVVLIYATLVGLFVADIVQRQQQFMHNEQVEDAIRLARGIAQAGTSAVLAGDVVGVQEVLAAVTGARDLRFGFVVDDDGKVLAHTDRALLGKYVVDSASVGLMRQPPQAHVLMDSTDVIDVAAPVLMEGRRVGWVRVSLGREHMHYARLEVVRDGLMYGLLAILIGAAFAALVGRQLTRSLEELLRVAEAIRDGAREERADVSGRDEIAALARAFNDMLDRLAESETRLQRLNEDLEQRVDARTADLTAASEGLRKSETLFRGLLESSADAIVLIDESGRILLSNLESSKVFGYERIELLGQPIEILIPERFTNHRELRDEYRRMPGIRPMGVGRQVMGRRKDGSEFPAEVRLSPLKTEEGLIVSAIVRDVTERQQAEDRLRSSERRYRLLLENLPQRVFSKDTDSVFEAVNPAFASLLDLTPEEIVGKTDVDLLPPEHAQRVLKMDREVLSTGRPVSFDDVYVKDGETRIFHTVKAPVRDEDDRIVGLLGISWDITARKRAEEALAEASRNAEAANRAKSEFLANMSHEIRTPMNAVIGLAHLLGQTRLDARQRDYLDKIGSSANALLALLNSILDLSKVEAGKLELETRPFRLDHLMRDLAAILSANAQGKDIEVLFDVDPGVPCELSGDALRLNQVLINLAGNAIKFTEQGEVVVSVRVVHLQQSCVELYFSIRDTGIGISADEQQRLFQAFQQADSSTSRRFGGSGLGLAISSRLVRLMGGELAVESEPGRGSNFFFTATFAPSQGVVDLGRQRLPEGLRVLLVDDNATARDILGNLVASLGWHPTTVASGYEALEAIEHTRAPYDLALLDWKMPVLDGIETARRIRQRARGEVGPAIVLITAYGREIYTDQTADLKAVAVLSKPVTAAVLVEAVEGLLRPRGAGPLDAPRLPARQPLAGMRLLVAEDNAVNQQVVSEMLNLAGATVVLANNGAEAVECFRLQGETFDAILMDLQMPKMDGFEATAQIRTLRAGRGMPIIAMTANAMASDRERCLAAGMNDHVAKPLSPDLLMRALRKWVRGRTEDDPAPAERPREAQPTVEGIDVETLLDRVGGSEETLRKLLELFLRQLPGAQEACRAAVEEGDVEALKVAAHSLKGMAGNVGADAVAAVAGRLERVARGGDERHAWHGLLASLCDEIARVSAGIERAVRSWSARAPAARRDRADLVDAFANVAELLRDDSFDAVPTFHQLQPELSEVLGVDAVNRLAEAIESFDFAAAQVLCAELTGRLAQEDTKA